MDGAEAGAHSLPALRIRQRYDPDVPEDVVVALLHLNDPNWDFRGQDDTSSFETDSFETDEKAPEYSGSFDHRSFKTRSSDYDKDSQIGSKLRFHSAEVVDYEEDSPYAEVRASVSNTDDPSIPVNTFRMWFLGIIFTLLISGLNQLFSLRYPTIYITGLVAQLVALPCGKFLEKVLPTTRFITFGYTWSLNPGPFNVKEHVLITVMSNAVAGGAYATDVIATQRIYFNQNWGFGYQILLCLSSQLIGFTFAGLVRQFLVWPSAMIYPGVLVNCALFNSLHGNYSKKDTRHMSRERFFVYATICSFVWYWFPGYIFTALSVFNWVCWIAPNNIVINQLFGYQSGLGMGFLTFDWSMISYVGSPLITPWWAQVNSISAFFVIFWVLAPILYYTNIFYAKYLPMSAAAVFDNTGSVYNSTSVIINGRFDVDAYKAYSPLYLPITFALSYGTTFASYTAVFVHTWFWYRRDLALQVRKSLRDNRDIHSRLMSVYSEVPMWWYGTLGAVAFSLGAVVIHVWDTQLPVWALVIAILIAIVFIVPIGILRALTNQTLALQILAELIVGYMLPGRPVAMMIFKTFCFITMQQALFFIGDLKLGHYMKIPPRTMFLAQVVATTICVVVVVVVQSWMFSNIPDLCTPHQKHHFTCPSTRTFASAAVIWGGVGPRRLFSNGALYHPLVYCFLVGALLPIPLYYLARRFPTSFWRFVNIPVMLGTLEQIPPASGINLSSWFMFGAIFQFYIRRAHFRWWQRFNYILSAALDSGVAIGLIIIFFTLQFPKGGVDINWWGNTVWTNTADYLGLPLRSLASGEKFGPTVFS